MMSTTVVVVQVQETKTIDDISPLWSEIFDKLEQGINTAEEEALKKLNIEMAASCVVGEAYEFQGYYSAYKSLKEDKCIECANLAGHHGFCGLYHLVKRKFVKNWREHETTIEFVKHWNENHYQSSKS